MAERLHGFKNPDLATSWLKLTGHAILKSLFLPLHQGKIETMGEQYFEGKTFNEKDTLAKGEYENCTFSNCNLAEADLSGFSFENCLFEQCNLSMAKLKKVSLRDVKFKNCKLLGLRFDDCNPFLLAVNFENCQLNYSSFYQLKLKGTKFNKCNLQEADFTETDLSQADFYGCDLKLTVFENTILEAADFRNAEHFIIDPEKNKITKAKFSMGGLPGLLNKYHIVIE